MLLSWLLTSIPTQATSEPISTPKIQMQSAHSTYMVEDSVQPHDQSYAASLPPLVLVLPFVMLLLMIATGPLLYVQFWHRYYPVVVATLASVVVTYYLWALQDWGSLAIAFMEYIQFMALITALYVTAGSILITLHQSATPGANVGLLFVGAMMANLIGTTGASMLLIRPYIKANKSRIQVYHIVFFIFIVSNVGGVLTPIGDPPLFLGFLSGVPFLWSLKHHLWPWLTALGLLLSVFYYLEKRNYPEQVMAINSASERWISFSGERHLIWFIIIIGVVFIDPHLIHGVPSLSIGTHACSFVRELILFGIAGLAYYGADPHVLRKNAFSMVPLNEVAILFVGLFFTMIPALQWVAAMAHSPVGRNLITHNTLYWSTGILSSVLDNAPTYLNFSAASMATKGADIAIMHEVQHFALGGVYEGSVLQLKAISVAAVFFGAMTYIGNGPNLMVKAIAAHEGVRMPTFFAYLGKFSIPILLPILSLIWVLFFAFA